MAGWATGNGARIDQWTCLSDNNQFWDLENPVAQSGYDWYELVNENSGKCLEVPGWSKSRGTDLDQYTSYGYDGNQEWAFVNEPVNGGHDFALVNYHSGLVIDVAGASQRNGARVDQWPWHSQTNQIWYEANNY